MPEPSAPLPVAPGGNPDAVALAAEVAALTATVAALAATDAAEKVAVGQRRINLIWEVTQAIIAVMLVTVLVVKAIQRDALLANDPLAIFIGMVITAYFSRTNHQKIGGVGGESTAGSR